MAQLSTKIKEYLKANSVNTVDFTTDVLLQDDGQGAYIKEWNISGVSKPSDSDLSAVESDANTAEANAQVIATRVALYGGAIKQLENIIENGLDAEIARVAQIKADRKLKVIK
jgi:hypothetical protein